MMKSLPTSQRKRDRLVKLLRKNTEKPDAPNTSEEEDAMALRPEVFLDGTDEPKTVEIAGVVNETANTATDDLWAEAYEECKLRENDLVDRYEKHMKAYTSTAFEDPFSPGKIAGLIKAQRRDLDAQRLTLRLRGKSIVIREQGENIVKFVLWFNSTISSALASQPYASLAWSAVSIMLPVSDNPTEKTEVGPLHRYSYS